MSLIKNEHRDQCGIVYGAQRKDTVDVAYWLKTGGVSAVFFNAGLDIKSKQETVEQWKSGAAI